MDLKSGYSDRAVRNGLRSPFLRRDADLSCDVAVVGAGLLRAQIERRPHQLTALFSFARLGDFCNSR